MNIEELTLAYLRWLGHHVFVDSLGREFNVDEPEIAHALARLSERKEIALTAGGRIVRAF